MDYTEEDVQRVAEAISVYDYNNGISANGEVSRHQRAEARAALDTLAAARRLLPADARTETVYGVRLVWDAGDRPDGYFAAANRAHAEGRYDYHMRQRQEQNLWLVTPHLVQRTETHGAGPWVPVEPAPEAVSWAEATRISREEFDRIEVLRDAAAQREAKERFCGCGGEPHAGLSQKGPE